MGLTTAAQVKLVISVRQAVPMLRPDLRRSCYGFTSGTSSSVHERSALVRDKALFVVALRMVGWGSDLQHTK